MTITQFETLLEQHGDSIFGFCYHLTGNKADAEDLYQDSIMKAFDRLEVIGGLTADDIFAAKNYILGVAVRLNKNFKRKKINACLDPESFSRLGNIQGSTDIVTETENKDIRETTQKIIRRLPDKLRIVIYLYYYTEMTVAEISEQLRVPVGTVKSRLNRAKAQIRTELEEMDHGKEKRSVNKKFA